MIDLVIVVIGVFIGIQVANWNAARIDENRAHGYLERIRADLDADTANYQNRMAFWQQVRDYGDKALIYAESADPGDLTQWELLLAYFQASQISEFYTTDATYNELESAGELGLIADIGLRDALAAYYTLGGSALLSERPEYRQHVRGIIPLKVQRYIWKNCWKSDSSMRQTMHACPAPVEEDVAGDIVDSLRRDPYLTAELRYWISSMDVAAQIGRDRIASAEQLRASIDAITVR
jgi:hypothetical protein